MTFPVIPTPDLQDICRRTNVTVNEAEKFLELVKRSMEPLAKRIPVYENDELGYYTVERRGIGTLKTKHGDFWQFNFVIDDRWEKYSVLVKAKLDLETLTPVFENTDVLMVRTDSGCETGQLFGDQTCECGEQLHLAMKRIEEAGEGVIINIPRQDGRGMGLTFKLATLWIQDELGANTVESAALLAPGGIIDIRTYAGVVCILNFFEIPESCKINLATNNPKKAEVFAANGYQVTDYTPIVAEPTDQTRRHLQAKQDYLGHSGLMPNPGEE